MEYKTPGQIAYEADRRARPCYDGGDPRPQWDDLVSITQWSWEKNPTPRWELQAVMDTGEGE